MGGGDGARGVGVALGRLEVLLHGARDMRVPQYVCMCNGVWMLRCMRGWVVHADTACSDGRRLTCVHTHLGTHIYICMRSSWLERKVVHDFVCSTAVMVLSTLDVVHIRALHCFEWRQWRVLCILICSILRAFYHGCNVKVMITEIETIPRHGDLSCVPTTSKNLVNRKPK